MNGPRPGWGFAAGTFGELVQGQIDDIPFLITLPIAWGTRATFVATDGDVLEVWPSHRKKALQAAELALDAWHKPHGGVLVVQSTLPVGKGMASSSADIVASIRAVGAFYGQRLSPGQIAQWAAQVEPTDGIMYPNVVAFNPLTGQLLERFGPMPPALILGVLGHGRINTEDHHRHRMPYRADHQQRLKEALKIARLGIEQRDVGLLGKAGRISAEVAYEREPDAALLAFLELAARDDLGVIIGHSGTVRGLLLPSPSPYGVLRKLEQRLWGLNAGPVHRLALGHKFIGPMSGQGARSGVPSLGLPSGSLTH